MDDAVEDRIGQRRDPDHVVPAIDGNLAGDDERAFIVAVFDYFEEIARLLGRQCFWPPIIQNEEFGASDRAQESGETRIAMRDRQICEEPGNVGIQDGYVFLASLCPRAQASPLLPRPAVPVTGNLRRSAIQSQAASLKNGARSSPHGIW